MSTSWHINHDPLNDCLPQPTWQQQSSPPPSGHSPTSYYTCVCAHFGRRTFVCMQIFQFVCSFTVCCFHMEIGKVFIHTNRNIAYTTRWPLALRERHEIKRSQRESKHTQDTLTDTRIHTHTHGQRGTPVGSCPFVRLSFNKLMGVCLWVWVRVRVWVGTYWRQPS